MKAVSAHANLSRNSLKAMHSIFNKHAYRYCLAAASHSASADALEFLQEETETRSSESIAKALMNCIRGWNISEGNCIHAHIIKHGIRLQDAVGNNLLNLYGKRGNLRDARQVFDEMAVRDAVSWTALMSSYAKKGENTEVVRLLSGMVSEGVVPDRFTLATIAKACSAIPDLEHGRQVHGFCIALGIEFDDVSLCALLDMYGKCGKVEDARRLFDRVYCKNAFAWTAMISGYAINGSLDEVQRLFLQMDDPGTVTWTAAIVGFLSSGNYATAASFFNKMHKLSVKLDNFVFSSVIEVCAALPSLELGRQVHALGIKNGFESNVFVENSLVDMYSKCGSLEDAIKVFQKISTRDIVSWTAMIVGYGQHGRGKDALLLFDQMQRSGLRPNKVTFLGVLYACSHTGLLNECCQYLSSMVHDYGLTPTVEHYTCMLDLLGRAGFLEEAEKLIHNLPVEADITILGTFLGACMMHGNVQMAQQAVENLLHSKIDDCSTLVLLSNIDAAPGKWEDVPIIRKLLMGKEFRKQPRCSWIEVNGRTHVFYAGK